MERKEFYKNEEWLKKQLETHTIADIAKLCGCKRQNIMFFMQKFKLKSRTGKGRPIKHKTEKDRKDSILESILKYQAKRKQEQDLSTLTGISKENSKMFSKIRTKTGLVNDEILTYLFSKADIHNLLK